MYNSFVNVVITKLGKQQILMLGVQNLATLSKALNMGLKLYVPWVFFHLIVDPSLDYCTSCFVFLFLINECYLV